MCPTVFQKFMVDVSNIIRSCPRYLEDPESAKIGITAEAFDRVVNYLNDNSTTPVEAVLLPYVEYGLEQPLGLREAHGEAPAASALVRPATMNPLEQFHELRPFESRVRERLKGCSSCVLLVRSWSPSCDASHVTAVVMTTNYIGRQSGYADRWWVATIVDGDGPANGTITFLLTSLGVPIVSRWAIGARQVYGTCSLYA